MTVTDVKERPILFSGPMVRAILEGRKTQTRRVMKPQPARGFEQPECSEAGLWAFVRERAKREWFDIRCRYGMVGELLWVREAWRPKSNAGYLNEDDDSITITYPADGARVCFDDYDDKIPADWTLPKAAKRGAVPSIHMPRWASRLTLEISGVRVERLWKITEADVLAEGIEPQHFEKNRPYFNRHDVAGVTFREPWDKINGKRPGCAWKDNPWVWVVEFRRTEAPR